MVINKNKPADWQGTHILICSHCFGKKEQIYAMYCNVIRETKNGKLLVDVFGKRFRQITGVNRRYVESYRVREYKNYFRN